MSRCTFKQGQFNCGSYAFNLYKEDIDQGGLCDVHYWQGRAHRAEALAQQLAQQEPFAFYFETYSYEGQCSTWFVKTPCDGKLNGKPGLPLYTSPPAQRKPLEDE